MYKVVFSVQWRSCTGASQSQKLRPNVSLRVHAGNSTSRNQARPASRAATISLFLPVYPVRISSSKNARTMEMPPVWMPFIPLPPALFA